MRPCCHGKDHPGRWPPLHKGGTKKPPVNGGRGLEQAYLRMPPLSWHPDQSQGVDTHVSTADFDTNRIA